MSTVTWMVFTLGFIIGGAVWYQIGKMVERKK